MSELLGTTIEALIATMKERRVRIPSEIGAFIALEVCEALASGPAAVRPPDVRIGDDGSISVFAPPGSATSEESARSVVALLGGLLVAAGTGVPRALVGLLERGPASGRWDLPSLRDDLEASLVPLNRAAARRVLARMLREAQKPRSSIPARPSSEAAPPPGDPTLDSQLDDLLGPDDLPPLDSGPSEPPSIDADLDATLAGLEGEVAPEERTIAEDSPPSFADVDAAKTVRSTPSDAPTQPGFDSTKEKKAAIEEPTGLDLEALGAELDAPKKSNPMPWILAFVAILAATAAALALSRPDLVDEMLGRPPPPPEPTGPTEEDRERERREQLGHYGTLTVQAIPGESQVLLYIGPGTAQTDELPVGVAHEFIAIAEGRAPARAFIPADAEWPDGRYELAIMVGTDEMAEEDLDLGVTTLPRDALGAPSGVLGTARIITNPPGAKVYLLIGYSPTVVVENVATDEDVELLIYHEGHPVTRQTISPGEWTENEDGTKRAQVSVTLEGAEPEPME